MRRAAVLIAGAGPTMPGDRAPDALCRLSPSAETTTLGEQTNAHWALLLFDGSETEQRLCAEAARSHLERDVRIIRIQRAGCTPQDFDDADVADVVVQDEQAGLADAYRPGRRSAILVRPDGHIAWRSAQLAPEGLRSWLLHTLDRPASERMDIDTQASGVAANARS